MKASKQFIGKKIIILPLNLPGMNETTTGFPIPIFMMTVFLTTMACADVKR
jgi:hypothetical protein